MRYQLRDSRGRLTKWITSVDERFAGMYEPEPMSGCWLWTGWFSKQGYGKLGVGSRCDGTGKVVFAHRVSWELHRGPIPKGLSVLHRCDNMACVNPDHLWLGTIADNNRDRSLKFRGLKSKSGLPFGVSYRPERSRVRPYHAHVDDNGTFRHVGSFSNPEDASAAAIEFKKKSLGVV